ncbi:phosphotransferase, partial [Salmonella enterica]
YGLVHTDLHSGNFLVNSDNRLQIFDLDDSC